MEAKTAAKVNYELEVPSGLTEEQIQGKRMRGDERINSKVLVLVIGSRDTLVC